ncbi:DUF106 domain-containing protein [Candidatus Pacearchaeota archaeon]|nr:DUF106 domain-containing protein [Candidatus Pacearchaeota archaeon]
MSFLSIVQQYPRVSIIVMALAVTFLISLINYFFLDKERLRELKTRQKETQKQIREHQQSGNHEKAMQLQKDMVPEMMEMFRHSMKPMLITIIPILVFFSFIKKTFAETIIASTWFWYYLVTAIIGGIIFRKLLKLP